MRWALLALCLAGPALAAPPESAPRPPARTAAAPEIAAPEVVRAASATAEPGVARSPRPESRPRAFATRFAVRRAVQTAIGTDDGRALCGDPMIRGAVVDPVRGRIEGCGIARPVRVESVSGIALSRAIRMDCTTAKALRTWIERGVAPAVGRRGGGLKEVTVIGGYACRTRNSRAGAKISEHGKGRAIDVAGIELMDGTRIDVERGWRTKGHGPILRAMHKSACGPFGTVLGPESDVYHQDHLHLDTARYRSGPYCR